MSFNQDSTCYAISNINGFIVNNCDPSTERFNRFVYNNESNGIGIVEMLFRSNIFALVGGGKTPKKPPNVLMIWDDFQNKCIAELEFKSNVNCVKLRREFILISVKEKAYLYNFTDLKLLKSYDIYPTNKGISCITYCQNTILAVPGNSIGTVIIDNYTLGKQHIIAAHEHTIEALALNSDGSRLATASTYGTIIRVWDTITGEKVNEFRRGIDTATINSLVFNSNNTQLLVSSDKGTVHLFSLIEEDDKNPNVSSKLSYISNYLPSYFNSKWSYLSLQIPINSICTFSNNSENTIYILTSTEFKKYEYDTNNGFINYVETKKLNFKTD